MPVPADSVKNYFGVVHGGYYEQYANIGARWNRNDYNVWSILEPGKPFSFDDWDREIGSALANGVTPLPLLGVNYTPPWATREEEFAFPPRSTEQVRESVEAFVARYSRPPFDLRFFEVSNEPNIGWFFRAGTPEQVHKEYIDKVLIPAAESIHKYGGKVVAPSVTMEWPDNSWPAREQPNPKSFNVAWSIKEAEKWLVYNDAWRHIDYFSLHYTKGDTEKPMWAGAENMMPLYDYLYDTWVKPGKIQGIWNTEEGLTAVEAGNAGEVSLEPWEVPPYGQWLPRYTVPVIHWAIEKGWDHKDQYKVFWYNIRSGGVLGPTSILASAEPVEIGAPGRAMGVLAGLFSDAQTVDVFEDSVHVGFGLYPRDTGALNYFAPYEFTSYCFRVDSDILVAAWMELPGLETKGPPIQAVVRGMKASEPVSAVTAIDYLTGSQESVSFQAVDGELRIELPRTTAPVLYFRVTLAAP